jgi:hypothetical protein
MNDNGTTEHRPPADGRRPGPAGRRPCLSRAGGDEGDDSGQREQADSGDRPEGRSPAPALADQRTERHTQHVRDRQPGEHDRHRAGLLLRRDQTAGDQGADAEERAVAQRRDDPPQQHHRIARRESGQQVADDEQRHQADQDRLAGQPRRRRGQRDRADRDTHGVPGDQPSRGRLGHRETRRHLRQQPGDQELGQTCAEPAECQRDQSTRHPSLPDRGARVLPERHLSVNRYVSGERPVISTRTPSGVREPFSQA